MSHALWTGTMGQPPRAARPSLKALAARVLEDARERVSLSHSIGNGALGQAGTSPVSPESAEVAAWGAEDWRVFFDERAGIAEFDGGQTREEAEAIAFQSCVIKWLNRHPVRSDPDRCAACGKPDREGHAVVPFGSESHGHAWLHPECWKDWHRERQEQARRALAGMGLVVPLKYREGVQHVG